MPGGPDTLRQTFRSLAARVEAIERQQAHQTDREPFTGEIRNPRLAITVANPNTGIYPSAPSGDEDLAGYWIRFVDASFPKVQGTGTPTIQNRQTPGSEFAFASNLIPGPCSYPPVNTPVLVSCDRTPEGGRNWWFTYCHYGDCEE